MSTWSHSMRYTPSYWSSDIGLPRESDRPSRIFDQDFGPGVFNDHRRRLLRPSHHLRHQPPPPPEFSRILDDFDRMSFMDRPYWAQPSRTNFNMDSETPKQEETNTEASKKEENGAVASPPKEEKKGKEGEGEGEGEECRGMSEVINDKDKYQVTLDVTHFAPEEISVKTVDQILVVECKHEDRPDEHGFVSRSFTRKYILPKEVNTLAVGSTLTPEGMLTVTAPKKDKEKPNERRVKIDLGR